MKIGLFGGTLDPIHLGHLRVAEEVRECLGLDEIWFLPAFLPPHKLARGLTPFDKRMEMVRLAVEDNPHFHASALEQQRDGISYSVDLLRDLNERFKGGHNFFFILGSDAFMGLDSWKEYEALPGLATLVIMRRLPHDMDSIARRAGELFPGYPCLEITDSLFLDLQNGRSFPDGLLVLEVTAMDISSTMIRELVKHGHSIRYLVPEGVMKYIMREGLYADRVEVSHLNTGSDPDSLMVMKNSLEIAEEICKAICDNKGERMVVLDMRGTSPVADFFIIAIGRSTRHVQGIASRMRRELSRKGIKCRGIEGEEEGKWILMDFDDAVVHLFYGPAREFYDLEGLWIDAPRLVLMNGRLIPQKDDI